MDVSCFVVYYVFIVVVFSGYLYAHISYLDDNCPACLLLLSTDRDAFFELAETRLKTVEVSCISLTLSLPQVTETEFLLTISIQYQAGR